MKGKDINKRIINFFIKIFGYLQVKQPFDSQFLIKNYIKKIEKIKLNCGKLL